MHNQGHNFGLKSGVLIQKENEAPVGPKQKGRKMERKYSLLIGFLGLGEHHELSQRGPGRAPAKNGFIVT